MQQYVDIYSLSRYSTCFGCHAPIIRPPGSGHGGRKKRYHYV